MAGPAGEPRGAAQGRRCTELGLDGGGVGFLVMLRLL